MINISIKPKNVNAKMSRIVFADVLKGLEIENMNAKRDCEGQAAKQNLMVTEL